MTRTARSEEGESRSQALEEIRRLRAEAQREASRARPEGEEPEVEGGPRLRPGVRVRVPAYDAEGPIVELRGDTVMVQLGLLRVEADAAEVEPVAPPEPERRGGAAPPATFGAGFDEELNIRGERVEQGLDKVRDFVLEAHALKVGKVRILHGKGTGALRDAVRAYLKDEKRVERFEDAVPYEGGHGVTVAYLRSSRPPPR